MCCERMAGLEKNLVKNIFLAGFGIEVADVHFKPFLELLHIFWRRVVPYFEVGAI